MSSSEINEHNDPAQHSSLLQPQTIINSLLQLLWPKDNLIALSLPSKHPDYKPKEDFLAHSTLTIFSARQPSSIFFPFQTKKFLNSQSIRYNRYQMALRRNYGDRMVEPPTIKPPADPSLQQYQLLLEFDLKRQKEKNAILQERLKNKQVFIQQMKHFQEELTLAYEQCKNQLILAQEKIQYLQNVEYREYTQQIADLKHMLIAAQQQSKRSSLARQQRLPLASTTAYPPNRNKSQKRIINKTSERRDSKVNSHFATQRERSLEDKLEQEVSKQFTKSVNFISHFLQMVECYLSELKSESKLGRKLKRSWKWIKDVVKEWDSLVLQEKKFNNFLQDLCKLYGINKDVQLTILLELIKAKSLGAK